MKKIYILSLLAALLFCQTVARADSLRIGASLPALGQIAQGVAGEFADVKVLAHVGQDPHFVPPKPTLARHLARADLLIAAGLGLEVGWLPPLIEASRNDAIRSGGRGYLDGRSVLTQVLGKPQGRITRELGDIHPEGNPHWWMDPLNGVRLAQVMSPLVSYHDSYLYLTQRFALQVIGFVEPKPGIEPSTSHLDALVDTIRLARAQGIWLEPYHDGAIARKLCEISHAPCRLMPSAARALRATYACSICWHRAGGRMFLLTSLLASLVLALPLLGGA